ncbi:MAG: hypothetical protein HY730_04185 [Candidatus Tectomicrobia bacterium]|uniref:Uncharacterized protein n=1 Tax=Tectimicrobiota bacterium TaxID=2528274 RepID=A0A933LPY7_UNCTE|nr:hypothetical protein [Candidatus Tectomicrobia bacterium]
MGIEPLERWSGCPALTNPKWIVQYINWMEAKGKRPTMMSEWPRQWPNTLSRAPICWLAARCKCKPMGEIAHQRACPTTVIPDLIGK